MGSKKNVDMSMDETQVKKVEAPEEATEEAMADGEAESAEGGKKAKKTSQKKVRSPKYQAVRAQVDKTRHYDAFSAIELVKKLSYSSFPGTIVAHLVLGEKHQGATAEVEFPHATGKSLRVAIADEATLKKIEAGEVEFDILLSTPEMMPKLTKFAKILGPQGLMPNPKQGTLLANPEERKKELEAGKMTLRTERKAPLMHVVIGKTEMDTKELQDNLQALTSALKGKLVKVSLAASMSPSVKVELAKAE